MNSSYTLLNLEDWKRKQHFEFYLQYEQPCFNMCIDLDAEIAYHYCRENHIAFSHAYLYAAMSAANQVENFRYRIAENEVRVYEQVAISVTQLAADETIRFSDILHSNNFSEFITHAESAKKKAISEDFMTAEFSDNQAVLNTMYMSVIPWLSFSSFAHATFAGSPNGIPKIVFGKMRAKDKSLPLSVEVHHSLMDGLQVGRFVDIIQTMLNEPEKHF